MPQERSDGNGNLVLVAIGGNVTSDAGRPRDTVEAALDMLAGQYDSFRSSRLYSTPAFPAGSGPDFVNAACSFRTDQSPADVLSALHRIEASFGRKRLHRWGQRTLDLDLIAAGDAVLPDVSTQDYWRNLGLAAQQTEVPEDLILPHPRVQDRAFALVPLADIAPEWCHPVLGQTIRQMCDARPASERATVSLM